MKDWLALVTSLPTGNATVRMRAWRALKASGAAVLRDGVYLMPAQERCRAILDAVCADVRLGGGSACLLRVEEASGADFSQLFDRSEYYGVLLAEVRQARSGLTADTAQGVLKQARKLRKTYDDVVETDFFPGESRRQAEAALEELEIAANRILSPGEPHGGAGAVPRRQVSDYRCKVWATRRRPWVDRLASAWLIRRFIDPEARFLWLDRPEDCPADALGFDFDGAAFSHVGAQVTFEVLAASFGLDQPSLHRIAGLVHYLDVGGVQPAEAVGIEVVLAGLRETLSDDDQLLVAAAGVFDALLATFDKGTFSS